MNMTGGFPIVVQYLPFLHDIRLGVGELRGPLPVIVGSMNRLTRLELRQNKFTGTIPAEWYHQLHNLRYLDLSCNELEGSISKEIGRLDGIESLFLYTNQLTGRIPDEIGMLTNLTNIKIQENLLEGEIPTEIGNLASVEQLRLDRNRLTGSIPSEIAKLASTLLEFNVAENSLSGDLPDAVYDETKLFFLDVSGCNLTGTISTKIRRWTDLQYLSLGNNLFSGSLPTELGLLTRLRKVVFTGNEFTGMEPREICEQLGSQMNVLNTGIGCPYNCCSLCCNSDSGL
jgi:Leucine-rich repeat (LRR) protein